MSWRCPGGVLEVSWRCPGGVSEVSWRCLGSVLEGSRRCLGSVLEVSRRCLGGRLGDIRSVFVDSAGPFNFAALFTSYVLEVMLLALTSAIHTSYPQYAASPIRSPVPSRRLVLAASIASASTSQTSSRSILVRPSFHWHARQTAHSHASPLLRA